MTESNESSSIDCANFDLRTGKASSSAPAAKAKGKKAATAGEKTVKEGTSAAKKLKAKPKPGKPKPGGGGKPSGGGGKGAASSAQPEWRQGAKKTAQDAASGYDRAAVRPTRRAVSKQ